MNSRDVDERDGSDRFESDDQAIEALIGFTAAVVIALAAIAFEAACDACWIQRPSLPSITSSSGSPTLAEDLEPVEGR